MALAWTFSWILVSRVIISNNLRGINEQAKVANQIPPQTSRIMPYQALLHRQAAALPKPQARRRLPGHAGRWGLPGGRVCQVFLSH